MIDDPTGPVRVLLSYAYYADQDVRSLHAAMSAGGEPVTMIADSGAFSAYTRGDVVTPTAYATWLTDHRDLFDYAITLDVLGNPEASWRSHRATEDAYGHRLVPVVHYGEPLSEIERYVEQGHRLIALGGMAISGRFDDGVRARWLIAAFRYAADAGVRFHGLGIGGPRLIADLPWWSVDATSWVAARYGATRLFDPLAADMLIRVDRAKRNAYLPGPARILRGLGVDPALLADRYHWQHSCAVSAWSYRRLEAWTRHRWGGPVTPPDDDALTCRSGDATGVRVHLVSSPPLLEYATPATLDAIRNRTPEGVTTP